MKAHIEGVYLSYQGTWKPFDSFEVVYKLLPIPKKKFRAKAAKKR